MKFFTKNPQSTIYQNNLVYRRGRTEINRKLRNLLLEEQRGFCAYTEEFLLSNTLCEEVEHFNASLKYNDDYFNYYAVSRFANQRKVKIDRENRFAQSDFFQSLFFQVKEIFDQRIEYRDGIYIERNIEDIDAKNFIDYVGLNDPTITKKRGNAIRRLKNTIGNFSIEQKMEFFRNEDKDILSFITAIEHEFQIDLSDLIND